MNLLIRAIKFFWMSLIVAGVLCIVAGAKSTNSYKVAAIDAQGRHLTSIFQGLPASRHVRDFLLLRVNGSVAAAPYVRNSEIGRFLRMASTAVFAACPTGGICGTPGSIAVPGQFCSDNGGCAVDVHNQAAFPDFTQGTLELYDCLQCCVDWSSCPIGGGGGAPDPPPCDIDPSTGTCGSGGSPIIVDTEGEGFHLTSAVTGVTFDISGTDHPVQIAWTDARFHNAFLALPGRDGLVHNGKELFGNFSPQPQSAHPNGFLALAQFDKPENGGNSDGIIDQKDAVFSRLRLWIDENHDGVCQANELYRLTELGTYSLALNYVDSRRRDEFGNAFRFKAQVNPGQRHDPRDETPSGEPGRWAYDVFFVTK